MAGKVAMLRVALYTETLQATSLAHEPAIDGAA